VRGRRRHRLLLLDDMAVANAVELAGRDPRRHVASDHFEHFRREPADRAHLFQFRWRFQIDRHVPVASSAVSANCGL